MPTKSHILIIDDDHDLRVLLRYTLEQMSFKVSTVTNGRDAIEYLKKNSSMPEMIILDIKMPIMNGNEFLKYKNQNPTLKDIPTLIVSSEKAECIESATIQKLKKPINLAEFITKVKECISNNSQTK